MLLCIIFFVVGIILGIIMCLLALGALALHDEEKVRNGPTAMDILAD